LVYLPSESLFFKTPLLAFAPKLRGQTLKKFLLIPRKAKPVELRDMLCPALAGRSISQIFEEIIFYNELAPVSTINTLLSRVEFNQGCR
jgi:hypothetical protein